MATTLLGDGTIDEAAHDEGDFLDSGSGDDVIVGDNALIERRGDTLSPRMRVLSGTTIYGATFDVIDGQPLVTGAEQLTPTGVYASGRVSRTIQLFDHDNDFEDDSAKQETHGDDYIAGGADDDEIFGQLGDDVIQGDGDMGGGNGVTTMNSIDHGLSTGDTQTGQTVLVQDDDVIQLITLVGAGRNSSDGTLSNPSVEGAEDGDDYVEGGGGSDVIFGNFGQDDLIGGSSSLFGLTTLAAGLRPDVDDTIFGGAGTRIERNDIGDATERGHASDADYILGDNGNIFRLVGINGNDSMAFLTFEYDNYTDGLLPPDPLNIIPRGIELLDYTFGDDLAGIGGRSGVRWDRRRRDSWHGWK